MNREISNKLPVSVIIATYNSELFLEECLESLAWADEIIVVDMYSSDRTIEIVKRYTDKIFFFRGKKGFPEPSYKFGIEKTTNNWIFIAASDEIVPYTLKEKIKEIIQENKVDVVYIPRKNFFFGTMLKGGGWGPLQDMHPRFFRKGAVSINEIIHNTFSVNKTAKKLFLKNEKLAIIHFNYIDPEHFIDKLNEYTTIEAINMFEGKKKKMGFFRIIYFIIREIGGRFIIKKGYKDRVQGFYLALLMASYRVVTATKYYLIKKYKSLNVRKSIINEYKSIARNILLEYKEYK